MPSPLLELFWESRRTRLQHVSIYEILATGLHAYLTQFLDRVNDLGAHISREFLVSAE